LDRAGVIYFWLLGFACPVGRCEFRPRPAAKAMLVWLALFDDANNCLGLVDSERLRHLCACVVCVRVVWYFVVERIARAFGQAAALEMYGTVVRGTVDVKRGQMGGTRGWLLLHMAGGRLRWDDRYV
jgi:hypothetical protein